MTYSSLARTSQNASLLPPSNRETVKASTSRKRKRPHPHPYLHGNFAPVKKVQPLTPCQYSGVIPQELAGGEYVRNGGNPVLDEDLGQDAHWFDGDGMLSGVSFTETPEGVRPEFVNQYVLTDLFLSSLASKHLRKPLLPSIATLVNPLSTFFEIILLTFRTFALVLLSRLPGSTQVIRKISVANTAVLFHDGRALATCESGPPMRIALPGLETVGWYNGKRAEGETGGEEGAGFGGKGMTSFMKEWTTAHPRVDPKTGELISFHSTFVRPFIHYSIIPATHPPTSTSTPLELPTRVLTAPVPGVSSAKMMHDFGVSFDHIVIMDLPLSLDPMNSAMKKPVVTFDTKSESRFGVFPRHSPQQIRWFKTKACCIFHTANTWDDQVMSKTGGKVTMAVNLLACRMTSASVVFSAGDIAVPQPLSPETVEEEEQCCLYYFQFEMAETSQNHIAHQFALSAVPFEFPSIREDKGMGKIKYVFGTSVSTGTFRAALGRVVKIDCLVKMDAETLIKRGKKDPQLRPITGCVDTRTVQEVLRSTDQEDPISIFQMPPGWYAQEPTFVARKDGVSEDDGWLLTYAFDESQLDAAGECGADTKSELWVIDAKDMKTVVARIRLTQRVPYGLHGNFFSDEQVKSQRPIETIRSIKENNGGTTQESWWLVLRDKIERFLG